MVYAKHDRGQSVGSFPTIPRMPPRPSALRTRWLTLSSSARRLLCLQPRNHVYKNHWPSDNKIALYTSSSRSNSTTSLPSPWDTAEPWNVEPEPRETKWDDGISTATTATKFSPPGSNLSSEAATSVNEPQIEESGGRRSESASPLYYDDHFDGHIRTRAKGPPRRHIPTGYTIDTLIDALLEIGDYEEDSDSLSVASLGMSSLFTFTDSEEEGNLEKAYDDKSTICGVGEEEDTTDYWEERRAWEDVKRRVMYVEESGAQPLDGAGPGDAERVSRELRARRRRNWAEEVVRGHAREEVKRRVSAKKRRRHAGWWVREDGVFVRLYARRI